MKISNLPDKPSAFELSEVMASIDAVGVPAADIAAELYVHPTSVSKWRNGTNLINKEHWVDLCHICQRHTHNEIASAVLAQLPLDEGDEVKQQVVTMKFCDTQRKRMAAMGIATRLLGNEAEALDIVEAAMEGYGNQPTLVVLKTVADICIDYMCLERDEAERSAETTSSAWDALFAVPDAKVSENAPIASLCQRAHEIVNVRNEEAERMYGPFSEGMERAAQIFSGCTGFKAEGKHMYMALVALKLSRQSYNHKEDNLLDAIAYLQGLDNLENGRA